MKIGKRPMPYLRLLELHKPEITYSRGRQLVHIESHGNKICVHGKTYSHTFELWKDKVEDYEKEK